MAYVERNMFLERIFKTSQMCVDSMEIAILLELMCVCVCVCVFARHIKCSYIDTELMLKINAKNLFRPLE